MGTKCCVLLPFWLGAVVVSACTGERPEFRQLAPDAVAPEGPTDNDASIGDTSASDTSTSGTPTSDTATSLDDPARSDETEAGGASNAGMDATTLVEGDTDASVVAPCTQETCGGGAICMAGSESFECVCPSGSKMCNEACIADTACCEASDCKLNQVCDASSACVCATDHNECDGECIADDACCGDADCPAAASCQSGSCVCDAGYSGDDCEYYFLGLGFVSGHVGSEAYGVSGDGSTVVGASYASVGGRPVAFRWRSDGMISLGFLPGGGESTAWATSGNGEVVVGDAEASSGELLAFRWNASMSALPLAEYGTYSTGRDVNEDGTVVVGWGDRDGAHRALVWTNGVVATYGSIDPLYFNAVNPGGDVFAGRMVYSPLVYNAAAIQFGTLTGYSEGEVLSLTASGTTRGVGYLSSAANERAVRWSGGGDAFDLGTLAGSSRALGVSADGTVIVGTSSNQAFVWDSGNGMRRLSDVLDAGGVNLSGWSLASATDVSSDGTTIVGYGTHHGATEAFIAKLP